MFSDDFCSEFFGEEYPLVEEFSVDDRESLTFCGDTLFSLIEKRRECDDSGETVAFRWLYEEIKPETLNDVGGEAKVRPHPTYVFRGRVFLLQSTHQINRDSLPKRISCVYADAQDIDKFDWSKYH